MSTRIRGDLRTKHAQIDQLNQRISAQRRICVTSRLYIHSKNVLGMPCPCCGSTEAYAYDVRDDLVLLIDPIRQTRKLRHEAKDVAEFDRQAAMADQHELMLRCSTQGLPHILDTHTRVKGLGGSARAGKTLVALYWFARQWMLRGGRGKLMWLIGPTINDAFNLLKKFLLGADGTPPVLPQHATGTPVLSNSYPTKAHGYDKHIKMIDGTSIGVLHASEKVLRGVTVEACCFTEAANVPDNSVYAQLLGRFTSSGGQLLIESTPRKTDHWTIAELRKLARDEAAAVEKGDKQSPLAVWDQMLAPDNPWLSPQNVEEWTKMVNDPVMFRREVLGIADDGDDGMWTPHWTDEARGAILFDSETWDVRDTPKLGGMPDITSQVAYAKGFRRQHDWLCGQDVNLRPCASLLCKVVGEYADPSTWKLIVYKTFDSWNETPDKHARSLRTYRKGLFANAAIVIDPTACMGQGHESWGASRHGVSSAAALFEKEGFEVLPARGTRYVAKVIPNADVNIPVRRILTDRRIHIARTKAAHLTYTLEHAKTRDGGITQWKTPNSRDDRLSAWSDALKYVIWFVFAKELAPSGRTPPTITW